MNENDARLSRARDGELGERLARWFLERRGYRHRESRVRIGHFEIDLVMTRGEELIFVEVKWRGPGSWSSAASSLGAPQRRRLAEAASAYASRHASAGCVRFDVIAIDESKERLVLEHFPDALGGSGTVRESADAVLRCAVEALP